MVEDSRKKALVADFEFYVNRYLDKQDILADVIKNIAEGEEEETFLWELDASFTVNE